MATAILPAPIAMTPIVTRKSNFCKTVYCNKAYRSLVFHPYHEPSYELNPAIRTEKDLKVRTRLMVVRAVLELGHSTENMAAVFDVTARCIRR